VDEKATYLLLEIRMLNVERVGEGWRCSVRHGDDFDWLNGHSAANEEALEVSSRGSWMLCTPSLTRLDCQF